MWCGSAATDPHRAAAFVACQTVLVRAARRLLRSSPRRPTAGRRGAQSAPMQPSHRPSPRGASAPLRAAGWALAGVIALVGAWLAISVAPSAHAAGSGQLQQRLSTTRQKVTGLAGDLAAAKGRVSQLNAGIASLSSRLAGLQSDLDAKRAQLLRLRSQLTAAQAKLTRLEGTVAADQRVLAQSSSAATRARDPTSSTSCWRPPASTTCSSASPSPSGSASKTPASSAMSRPPAGPSRPRRSGSDPSRRIRTS